MEQAYLTLINLYVIGFAHNSLGYGEAGGNNRGKFIAAIGGKQGKAWCAAFAGYCVMRAFQCAGRPMPFERSLGAKRLTKNMGAVGSLYSDPSQVIPGDLVCFHRRLGPIDWRGHVGIVVKRERLLDGWRIRTIEGNALKYPSPVGEFVYEIDERGNWVRVVNDKRIKVRFWRFATLRKGVK